MGGVRCGVVRFVWLAGSCRCQQGASAREALVGLWLLIMRQGMPHEARNEARDVGGYAWRGAGLGCSVCEHVHAQKGEESEEGSARHYTVMVTSEGQLGRGGGAVWYGGLDGGRTSTASPLGLLAKLAGIAGTAAMFVWGVS